MMFVEFFIKIIWWVVNWWVFIFGLLYLVNNIFLEYFVICEKIFNCLEKRFDGYIL